MTATTELDSTTKTEVKSKMEQTDLKALFLSESTFLDHYNLQNSSASYEKYVPVLFLILAKEIDVSSATKSRVLAAALARRDWNLARALLFPMETTSPSTFSAENSKLLQKMAVLGSKSLSDRAFTIAEVLRALTLIDSGRKKRSLEKKIERYTKQGCKNAQKLGQMRSTINDLSREEIAGGALSKSVAHFIALWTRTILRQDLEFYALNFPKEPWIELADLCHLKPTDFQYESFLEKTFAGLPNKKKNDRKKNTEKQQQEQEQEQQQRKEEEEEEEEGNQQRQVEETAVATQGVSQETSFPSSSTAEGKKEAAVSVEEQLAAAGDSEEAIAKIVLDNKIPYSYLRKRFEAGSTRKLPCKACLAVASYESLETVLWYWEELVEHGMREEINEMIRARLEKGEVPIGARANYGKLMERLLKFRKERVCFFDQLVPIADQKLKKLKLTLEPPVAVIGDASSSMDVAIDTANIFASMITLLANASLSFFNSDNIAAPFLPKCVDDVLEITARVRASGSTAPAASLWPYYHSKQVLKFIIMATDEEENTVCHDYRFGPLLKKYRDEVYPVKMIFISFLRSPGDEGQMARELKKLDVPYIQFKLNSRRPDLTKLDALLGMISSESSGFEEEVAHYASILKEKGVLQLAKFVIDSNQP